MLKLFTKIRSEKAIKLRTTGDKTESVIPINALPEIKEIIKTLREYPYFLIPIINAIAGNAKRLSKWTPMPNPAINAIKNIHLILSGCSDCNSHFNADHIEIVRKNMERAYTSPSIADNQNDSVKANESDPINALPVIRILLSEKFLAIRIIIQNKNIIVSALEKADNKFMAAATFCGFPNESNENNLPRIIKNGAPEGWLTSSFAADKINSLQSQ